jgi:hypothetical protein
VLKEFSKYLTDVKYAFKKEGWHISGILKNASNQNLKFDVRNMRKVSDSLSEKEGTFNSKADKMIFDTPTQWIILDIEEMHKYLKDNKKKEVNLNELMSELDWNMVINKQ